MGSYEVCALYYIQRQCSIHLHSPCPHEDEIQLSLSNWSHQCSLEHLAIYVNYGYAKTYIFLVNTILYKFRNPKVLVAGLEFEKKKTNEDESSTSDLSVLQRAPMRPEKREVRA